MAKTYAVVDKSKKKKNRSLSEKGEDSAEATGAYSTMALYSVVEQCNIGPEVEGEAHTETHSSMVLQAAVVLRMYV